MASEKCVVCSLEVKAESDSIQCTGLCKGVFHFYCAGFSEKSFRITEQRRLHWRCLKCQPAKAQTNKPSSLKASTEDNMIVHTEENLSPTTVVVQKSLVVETESSSNNPCNSGVPNTPETQSPFVNNFVTIPENQSDLKQFIAEQFKEFAKNLEFHNNIVSDLTKSINQLNRK
ncbi:hypothetical protein JTE90_020199 [Oedothorax gibbosus]|uniref:PHD-type domain-containing protein n=1 Tax=Oedothorax gibbosus TaxID=931172 RepID=A0AAV6TTY2_9ARAC|nr:hypothetical protein JTE90_020199 [Oedothorax gibbosus]